MSDEAPIDAPLSLDDIGVEVIANDGTPDVEDELYASIADEEMSEEPDEESSENEDDEEALGDEDDELASDDDDDEEESDEDALLRQKAEEYDRLQEQLRYQAEQQRNQQYWDGIAADAEAAFEYKFNKIMADSHKYVDPEAHQREKLTELRGEIEDWYSRFEASKSQAKARQQEKAAIPIYAARVATHYGLTEEQAQELLEYHPQQMVKEAQRRAAINQRIAKLEKANKQEQRKKARGPLAQHPIGSGGSGKSAPVQVRAGSMNHLQAIFAAAQAGRRSS